MEYATIHQRICVVRLDAGLTQAELAGKIGVSPNFVYQMETGRRTPSPAIVREICRQLGIREAWLVDGTGEMRLDLPGAMAAADRVRRLLVDRPESTAARVLSVLVGLDPDGPEWVLIGSLLDRIEGKKAPES